MDIADRDRLTKLVGMLGSDQLGERAAAAAFIQKLADKYKVSVADLMATGFSKPAPPPPPPPRQPPPRQPPPPPKPPPWQQAHPQPMRQRATWNNVGGGDLMLQALREIVDNEERFEFTLNSWEWQFTEDVALRYSGDHELSDKQKAIIERIISKCKRALGG